MVFRSFLSHILAHRSKPYAMRFKPASATVQRFLVVASWAAGVHLSAFGSSDVTESAVSHDGNSLSNEALISGLF